MWLHVSAEVEWKLIPYLYSPQNESQIVRYAHFAIIIVVPPGSLWDAESQTMHSTPMHSKKWKPNPETYTLCNHCSSFPEFTLRCREIFYCVEFLGVVNDFIIQRAEVGKNISLCEVWRCGKHYHCTKCRGGDKYFIVPSIEEAFILLLSHLLLPAHMLILQILYSTH